jgi:hypothetical protein
MKEGPRRGMMTLRKKFIAFMNLIMKYLAQRFAFLFLFFKTDKWVLSFF